jgi:hypothetical protein
MVEASKKIPEITEVMERRRSTLLAYLLNVDEVIKEDRIPILEYLSRNTSDADILVWSAEKGKSFQIKPLSVKKEGGKPVFGLFGNTELDETPRATFHFDEDNGWSMQTTPWV